MVETNAALPRFLATIGAGGSELVRLASSEFKKVLGAEVVEKAGQCRFFFSAAPEPVERFEALHSPEKVYAVVIRRGADEFVHPEDGPTAEDALASVIAESDGWDEAIDVWKAIARPDLIDVPLDAASPRGPLRFRVSGKRSGSRARHLSSLGISEAVGAALLERRGWTVDLQDFDVEIVVHLNDDCLLVLLPLLERGGMLQQNFDCKGLCQPVAWAIARSVDIQPGEVVLDPMCGAGIVLLEAAQRWRDAVYLGFDMDTGQLSRLASNLENLSSRARRVISLARADATRLPLASDSVDAIVCDLPFGKLHGSEAENEVLYPAAVAEFHRVLRPSVGRAALLTNQANQHRLIAALAAVPGAWTVTCRRKIPLGKMESILFLCKANLVDTSAEATGEAFELSLPPESMRLPWEYKHLGRSGWGSQKAVDREPLRPITAGRKWAR
eukprot:TRINITY_DN25981_c0_g2_i1.p1 TRINITY_DN25981_c0_g2~~TRINITY_DN25981_c0_g2_i1.p1  ORF type:complete len:443 (-),score=56.10 TRINITY_DN25981_c0_g2_i1:570-1898(-)